MSGSKKVIVLAGTAGTGKSSIGDHILKHYKNKYPNIQFIEGDDLHPEANVKKMSEGHPLNDDDRWGWLQTIAHESAKRVKEESLKSGVNGVCVVACSSLKLKYRDLIRDTEPNVDFYFIFLYASKETILYRLNQRKGHFMKSNMLESQFADLQLPNVSVEPNCFVVNMDGQTFTEIEDKVSSICDEYIL